MASLDKSKPDPSESLLADELSLPAASISAAHPPEIPTSPNPWEEEQKNTNKGDSVVSESKPISFDSSLFDQQGFSGLNTGDAVPTPKTDSISKEEILNEFDPLASMEEKAAREAWEKSEGHLPPPPRTPSPPLPPMKDLYISSPMTPDGPQITSPGASTTQITSPTPFASLATFAKSIALPLVKSIPQPFDGSAKAVSTPTSFASFANQQDASRSDAGKSVASGVTTPHRAGGGEDNSSAPSRPGDGTFDFQTFLDQMKTKSAEPVSRFLRS